MAEPTLNIPMTRLAGRIGDYLGYGYGAVFGEKAWTDRQVLRINDCLDSALRQFYFPGAAGGGPATYEWSFLRPYAELTLSEGEFELELPQDFGGLGSQITVQAADDTSSIGWPIDVANEPSVRAKLALYPAATGRPVTAAVAPQRGVTAARSPRMNMVVYPTADMDYTLGMAYSLVPDALTSANPWAYGGAEHAETLVASCLAMAELLVDGKKAERWAYWETRLAASLGIDRMKKGQNLGYNADRSDDRDLRYGPRRFYRGTVLFDGTQY